MIKLTDLKSISHPPREYWINIYKGNHYGYKWATKFNAMNARNNSHGKPIYRIHVRLK